MVLAYLSKEEYQEIHESIGEFSAIDESISQTIIAQKPIPKQSLWSKVIHYQIPFYQVAATFLLVVSSFWWLSSQNAPSSSTKGTSIQTNVSVGDGYYPEDLVFEL